MHAGSRDSAASWSIRSILPVQMFHKRERWMTQLTHNLDSSLLAEIEELAVEIARGGGSILSRYFGSALEIEYKDEKKTDPVTAERWGKLMTDWASRQKDQ